MDTKVSKVAMRNYEGVRKMSLEEAEAMLNNKYAKRQNWVLADPDWEVVDGSLHRKAKKETKEKK